MAKKKEAAPVDTIKPYDPPTCIRVTKDVAKQFSVGEKVSITVSGEVVGVSEGYGEDGKYEVKIKGSKVSNVRGAENKADKVFKAMTGK